VSTARKLKPIASRHTPRGLRSKIWFDTAFQAAKASGLPAIECAEIALRSLSGERTRINDLKQSVEGLLHRHPDQVRMHYGEIARGLPQNLDDALREVERTYRAEVAHVRQLADYALGSRHHGNCLTRIDRLRNVRLILRLMRFTGHADAYAEIREAVAAAIPLVEAARAFHRKVNPAGYRR
jgi:hypothetical protein